MDSNQEDVSLTVLLRRYSAGDSSVGDQLAQSVYEHLHGMAHRQMRGQPVTASLQASALVSEAFVKLFTGQHPPWSDRSHFYKVAASAMRSILVDHARRRQRREVVLEQALEQLVQSFDDRARGLLGLHESLERLKLRSPLQVQIVELRFFGGCSELEVARILDTSERTIRREWALARVWLREDMARE